MKTNFLLTIDVETRRDRKPEYDILGILPGYPEHHGIEKIMGILESAQAYGTFFMNAYEVAKHDEAVIAEAAKVIHTRGHDLELHTHPRPMYQYYGMSHASVDEQVTIMQSGIALLEQWTGKKIIAHRAGAFLANADTLQACSQVGLIADCSLAPGSRNPGPLVDELGASNMPRKIGTVWEIPVTYYNQFRLVPWRSRRILDIEASSLAEIKYVTRWALEHELPTLCVLLHSFSLFRHGQPNRPVIKRLSALMTWLRELDGIEVCTIEQTCARLTNSPIPTSATTAPVTGVWLMWNRALSSWHDGWRNGAVVLAGIASAIGLLLVLIYIGHVLFN